MRNDYHLYMGLKSFKFVIALTRRSIEALFTISVIVRNQSNLNGLNYRKSKHKIFKQIFLTVEVLNQWLLEVRKSLH